MGTGPVEARDVRPAYDHLGKVQGGELEGGQLLTGDGWKELGKVWEWSLEW